MCQKSLLPFPVLFPQRNGNATVAKIHLWVVVNDHDDGIRWIHAWLSSRIVLAAKMT